MEVRRRGVLALGAAAVGAGLLGSCEGDEVGPVADGRRHKPKARTSPAAAERTRDPEPAPPPPFPGAPPEGKVYYGASLPKHRSLPEWEAELGERLALNRSFFGPANRRDLVAQARRDIALGRLPHVSIKPYETWARTAARRRGHWLTTLLEELGALRRPVFLTITHEPENKSGPYGMLAGDFVAMQRRAIELAAEVAPNVTIVPVLQQWTFDPMRTDIRPRAWIVPEAAVFGLDVYNPWSPNNGKPWRSLGSKVDEVLPWIGSKPIAIGEYGTRTDPLHPSRTIEWLQDAADYARANNVVSMSYYNSSVEAVDGSFELSGAAERCFADLLASSWVWRAG